MSQVKNNKIMRRVMIMAVLMLGLFFVGANQALAQETNVALGKPATQINTYPHPCNPGAGKAVDGNVDGDFANC